MIVCAMLPAYISSDEAPDNENLSWEDAVEEAGKWLGSLQLGRVLDGQTLKKRGAKDVILPPV
jgi:hypothetical protein